ncbi:MAG: hypothetical protein KBD01_00145 [Acidobacteria bacterium]|nr:hypothetical protein [Acidobacteriota bacterium]
MVRRSRFLSLALLVVSVPVALAVGNVEKLTSASGDTIVTLEWSLPSDPTFVGALVLARAGSPVADAPVDGQVYQVGDPIGSSTVVCQTTALEESCEDTSVSNGTVVHYKVFGRDATPNYASGVAIKGIPRSAAQVRWAVTTEASALGALGAVPGSYLVGTGNDALLHRMDENSGRNGPWDPPVLGGAAQGRPMVGDIVPGTGDYTAFVSSQNGYLYRYSLDDSATLDGLRNVADEAGCTGGMLQSSAVAMIDAFDDNTNNNDNVLIQATRCGATDNKIMLYSHDLGTYFDSYAGGADGLGISSATPIILYRHDANNLVYVPVDDDGGESLVVLSVDSGPSFPEPPFAVLSSIGDVRCTPAMFLRNQDALMVVANTSGDLHLYLATVRTGSAGSPLYELGSYAGGDGPVKGVAASTTISVPPLFENWVVWATDTLVHGIKVGGDGRFDALSYWEVAIAGASAPLVLRNVTTAGDVLAYVGAAGGMLYELNALNHGAVSRSWAVDDAALTLGDPTFDYNDGSNQGIVIGSTGGTYHWVPIN